MLESGCTLAKVFLSSSIELRPLPLSCRHVRSYVPRPSACCQDAALGTLASRAEFAPTARPRLRLGRAWIILPTMSKKPQLPRPVHPFPARMATSIPWAELQSRTSLRVLDPMVGSGTTLVVARALGHRATGFDMDPLAVLLSQVWCSSPPPQTIRAAAATVLARASKRWEKLRGDDTYPVNADDETRSFVRYWFNLSNRRQLRALADAIAGVKNARTRRVLWVAFSRLIIAKQAGVSYARDLAHSRPHKVDKTPLRALDHFLGEVEKVLTALATTSVEGVKRLPAGIAAGDARRLSRVPAKSIDVIVTSPPYLNAIDYLRTSKFTLVWQGRRVAELRETRSTSIGSEVSGNATKGALKDVAKRMGSITKLPERQQLMLTKYLQDMDEVFGEFRRVLAPGGRVILVVGDTAVHGVRMRNSVGLIMLAERHGLTSLKHTRRPLPANRRYLPPPAATQADLKSRMRTEVVLRFKNAN